MTLANVALAMDKITQLFPIYSSIQQKQILLVTLVKDEISSVGDRLLYSDLHHIYIDPI